MIVDIHAHAYPSVDLPGLRAGLAKTLAQGAFHGVDFVCISVIPPDEVPRPTSKEVRACNDHMLTLMRENSDRVLGLCFLNPLQADKAVAELDRCVGEGACGIKLLWACKPNHPSVDPIAERAAELGVPILQHCSYEEYPSENPLPPDVAELGARHPRTNIVMAHLMACRERGVLDIQPCPNVHVDVGGYEPEAGMVEYAVRKLGAERVVFASDSPFRSYGSTLARVYDADISPKAKRQILAGNARRVLTKRFGQ